MPTQFTQIEPTLENYWRSIILFGRNVAAYKFALGKSLLELSQQGNEIVRLDELAGPFARHICEHLKNADKQGTSRSSEFLNACRQFNAGDLNKEDLLAKTTRLGFVNVIDAFHVVHDGHIDVRFFADERKGEQKAIRLTDDLFRLTEQYQATNLPTEIEARWRLVETSWELSLPRQVLTVRYDPDGGLRVSRDRQFDRKPITACRDALNGYQKGKCFYCVTDVSISPESDCLAEVDHFIPHTLKSHRFGDTLDGIWNLVLACKTCNRGAKGKFSKVPAFRYLERLYRRNEFFITSHHPLRETLMAQTGPTEPARVQFLNAVYNKAKALLVSEWEAENELETVL